MTGHINIRAGMKGLTDHVLQVGLLANVDPGHGLCIDEGQVPIFDGMDAKKPFVRAHAKVPKASDPFGG